MLPPGACWSVPPALTITRRAPSFNHSTACHPTHAGCCVPASSIASHFYLHQGLRRQLRAAPGFSRRSQWSTGPAGTACAVLHALRSSDQVCAIVPRAKFPSRVLTRRFRFLFYNFPGSDGARFRMVRTGVCRRCGHMGRHYLGASAFLVPRWPHHPEWDRSPVKTTSRRLVVFAIELH